MENFVQARSPPDADGGKWHESRRMGTLLGLYLRMLFPLLWGEVREDKSGVGYCCFTTARDVKLPTAGSFMTDSRNVM